jgi:hypothetical protein
MNEVKMYDGEANIKRLWFSIYIDFCATVGLKPGPAVYIFSFRGFNGSICHAVPY